MSYRVFDFLGGFITFMQGFSRFIAACIMALAVSQVWAADLQWSGRYRIEGNFIKNFTLDKNAGVEDSYIIHHLIMEPKIIATDGFNIKSRFDIFNNPIGNDQHGMVFGDYTGVTNAPGAQPPAVLSQTGQAESIQVTELYLNWVNEFGALVAGRVPFQFGLGMKYNSGLGNFDHYLSTRDMVAYKLALGNITVMPAYGKVKEGNLLNEDDMNDYLVVAEYANPESDISLGFMFDQRSAPQDATNGNDFPTNYFSNVNSNFGAATVVDGFSAYNMNFYVKKKMDNFNLGVEVGFINGYTGLHVINNGASERAEIAGFGGAAELGYKTGNIKLNLRAGMASGDDPDTTRIESYFFSPNYQVAMIMFHYPVGQYDVLRSALAGTRPSVGSTNPAVTNMAGLDTELITNAIYFAPNVTWSLGDRYDLSGTFCYANEMKPAVSTSAPPAGLAGSGASSLGFETDFGLSYHPNDKFTWETTLGFFFPGDAFGGPNGGLPKDVAYGASSKAAINF